MKKFLITGALLVAIVSLLGYGYYKERAAHVFGNLPSTLNTVESSSENTYSAFIDLDKTSRDITFRKFETGTPALDDITFVQQGQNANGQNYGIGEYNYFGKKYQIHWTEKKVPDKYIRVFNADESGIRYVKVSTQLDYVEGIKNTKAAAYIYKRADGKLALATVTYLVRIPEQNDIYLEYVDGNIEGNSIITSQKEAIEFLKQHVVGGRSESAKFTFVKDEWKGMVFHMTLKDIKLDPKKAKLDGSYYLILKGGMVIPVTYDEKTDDFTYDVKS
jgi:hypothetical protein